MAERWPTPWVALALVGLLAAATSAMAHPRRIGPNLSPARAARLNGGAGRAHRARPFALASRYRSFLDGRLGTQELVSGSLQDGLLKVVGIPGIVIDLKLRDRGAPTPTARELDAIAYAARQHLISTDVREASRAKPRASDVPDLINANARWVRSVLAGGGNLVEVGSPGLSLHEMYRFYQGLPRAIWGRQPAHQALVGIGFIDQTRVNDVELRHEGRAIPIDDAITLVAQGREIQVVQTATSRPLTDVDGLVRRIAEHDNRARTTTTPSVRAQELAAAKRLRERVNQATRAGAFEKAKHELLLAHLAGTRIFLFDTHHKDVGLNRFAHVFTDHQLVELADRAHELGMDIWAAGSILASEYGRIVKAGWDLVSFDVSARDGSGPRPERSGSRFVSISPAEVGRLQDIRAEAEVTREGQLANRKKELLRLFHSSRRDRARAFAQYQLLQAVTSTVP